MVQIVLIRPGSTDYDDEGRIQGTLDIPLNQHGTDEVQRIIGELGHLGIATIYTCPCQASLETATALAEGLGAKLKKLEPLRNVDHGLWQGMLMDEVKRKQPKVFRQWQEQPESICPPEGEMFQQAQDRVDAALAKLLKKHKQGTIALVVPEPLASVIHSSLSSCEISEIWKGGLDCAKWEVIAPSFGSLASDES